MGAKTRGNYPHYPNVKECCEKCVFGTGEHAIWCTAPDPEPVDEADFSIQAWPPIQGGAR